MNIVCVLIIIDALGASSEGSLQNNVYLVDTEKFLGSWNEGGNNLHTLAENGQLIKWSITSISADNQVEIVGFSGDMVSKSICQPVKQGIEGDISWIGRVENNLGGRYTYTVQVSVDGKVMSFNAFLESQ